jgi:uncharacterized DUF497 family protein
MHREKLTPPPANGIHYQVQDREFEWHEGKAARNAQDHGVTFEMARAAFRDAFAVEWRDDSQDAAEPRYSMLGTVDGRLLYVAYTERKGRVRVISARRATARERKRYHEENET